MTGFVAAVQFLTRVPVRTRAAVPHERVVPWFAVVGCVIGAAVGGVAAGMWHLVPPLVAGACAVGAGLLITGAFHEDGLADVADAFGGGTDRARRMEILKDSRHGTYGVAALCTAIVVRVGAAGTLASPLTMFGAFVAAHGLARAGAMAALLVAPAATAGGLAAEHGRQPRPVPMLLGMLTAAGVAALVLGWWVWAASGLVALGTGAVVWMAIRKIGGIVGDVLGAIEQISECAVLVLVSGLAAHGHIG